MKRFLKNSEGFTLVELMVVVAIIGILSAVAIPNFKKYQAKSKQSEAKIQLAALYTAEVSGQADHDTYATCINTLGYETAPKGYYVVGFGADNDVQNVLISAACVNDAVFAAKPGQFQKAQGTVDAAAGNLPATSVTAIAFTAGAVGQISASTGVGFDGWTMNESKALVNSAPGI